MLMLAVGGIEIFSPAICIWKRLPFSMQSASRRSLATTYSFEYSFSTSRFAFFFPVAITQSPFIRE
jgi:hypothetical protein